MPDMNDNISMNSVILIPFKKNKIVNPIDCVVKRNNERYVNSLCMVFCTCTMD